MALSADEVREVYSVLLEAWRAERPRLELIRSYMRNEASDIYVPTDVTSEYQMLIDQARFNLCPLVVTTVAQGLFIDGYRPTSNGLPQEGDNPLWEVWQRNRMDARQAQVYRPAITYGTSYLLVLPGKPAPVMTPLSPWRCTALYEDVDDEWPKVALVAPHDHTLKLGVRPNQAYAKFVGAPTVRIFDDTNVWTLPVDALGNPDYRADALEVKEHGLGVCPIVRFRKIDDDGCESFGKIQPLLPIQRQVNQTTFGLLMTQQFQAFKQRWVTGMAIERDENGNIKEPWNAAANSFFASDSTDTEFGEFGETRLDGYLASREAAIMFAASTVQMPPHNLALTAGISNIAAETLAALESSHQLDVADYKTSFGECMEQALRLAGLAQKDTAAWEDFASEVAWRDTTPRSLGQLVDALGKMAAQLGIPEEELWPKIPGATEQELARWKAAKSQAGFMAEMAGLTGADGGDPSAEIRAQADALGVLIRAGVDPTEAAARVGLGGIEFTGAVPVSLRLPQADAAALETA